MAVVALRHISVQKRLFLVSKRISRLGFRADGLPLAVQFFKANKTTRFGRNRTLM
jgi:hypothetical protein